MEIDGDLVRSVVFRAHADGYDREEVDEWMADLAADLDRIGRLSLSAQAYEGEKLAARVENATFSAASGGHARAEVDNFVAMVSAECRGNITKRVEVQKTFIHPGEGSAPDPDDGWVKIDPKDLNTLIRPDDLLASMAAGTESQQAEKLLFYKRIIAFLLFVIVVLVFALIPQ